MSVSIRYIAAAFLWVATMTYAEAQMRSSAAQTVTFGVRRTVAAGAIIQASSPRSVPGGSEAFPLDVKRTVYAKPAHVSRQTFSGESLIRVADAVGETAESKPPSRREIFVNRSGFGPEADTPADRVVITITE